MKRAAYHIERDLLQCNHWDEADKWLTERYIQHNPLVTSGRAGVVKFFGSRPRSATCVKLNALVVAVLADGNSVTVVTVSDRKDSKGQTYTGRVRQQKFASEMGLSQGQLSKVERGKGAPTLELLLGLAAKFRKTIDWIVRGED